MHVAVTGSTGFLGSRLVASLRDGGHEVLRVVRPESRPVDGPTVLVDEAGLEGIDAVVHLAGEGIATKRWNDEQKRRIIDSRVEGTTSLANVLASLHHRPRVLLSASGMDYYGDTGDEVVTEEHPRGTGFLADVCEVWESSTAPARDAGIRVALLRTTMVLGQGGGALDKMLRLFKLGLGGRMGSGRQWWSWISVDDWVAATTFLLDAEVSGPVNMGSPGPVTNADFTKALGAVLHRPTVLPVPAFGPRLLLGRELADTLLESSHRIAPAVLERAGFTFRHPDVTAAFRAVLAE